MKDNNKKQRDYRDVLAGIDVPDWNEMTEEERQEAMMEIVAFIECITYTSYMLNEAVKRDNHDLAISLFNALYRQVLMERKKSDETAKFLEEHPQYKADYNLAVETAKNMVEEYNKTKYKLKPEFQSSYYTDKIKQRIAEVRNMSDGELLKIINNDDKMKELSNKIKEEHNFTIPSLISSIEAYAATGNPDLSSDENKLEYAMSYFKNAVNFFMYGDNIKQCIDEVEDGSDIVSKFFRMFIQYHSWIIDFESLYLNIKSILIKAGEDIDNENISQLIINYIQKTRGKVKWCLNQLSEKDKKIHDLNIRIRELESEHENNNRSEEVNNTSSSN
jgi:hypothetical protein